MNDQVTGDEIINKFKNGSTESLSTLFNLHYTPLCFFAQRLIDDKDEAEDIVVDAFVKLWERRPDVKSMQNVKAYLYIATRNACFNYLRKSERTSKLQSDLMYLLSGREEHTLDDIIKAEVFDKVYQALESLPPQCKKIAFMSFIDGMKNQE
ncbi:MAG: sigma-70 family RNA polymerase sigma factor, partial [Chitinophagaceae bacterium]